MSIPQSWEQLIIEAAHPSNIGRLNVTYTSERQYIAFLHADPLTLVMGVSNVLLPFTGHGILSAR